MHPNTIIQRNIRQLLARVVLHHAVSVIYEEDVYEPAWWLLRLDIAKSTPSTICRHTIHGLAHHYSSRTNTDVAELHKRFAQAGLPQEATIEPDEDIA